MSIFKVINVVVLLGFLNTISYFPCYMRHNVVHPVYHTAGGIDLNVDFDGDTLLECILDDVLDMPSSGEDTDAGIFFKHFNFLSSINTVSVKVLESFVLSIKPAATTLLSRENHFISKTTPLLGYYTFLFRLNPF